MKKVLLTSMLILSVLLIAGCAHKEKESKSKQEASQVKQTTSKSQVKPEPKPESKVETKTEMFNKLSIQEKVYLYTSIVDERIATYPSLEGLELYYCIQDKDIYLFLTSGAGSGHPIYHITINDDAMKANQAVVYMGVDGYQFLDVSKEQTSVEKLYDQYDKYKNSISTATPHIKEDVKLKDTFAEQVSKVPSAQANTSSPPQSGDASTLGTNVSKDELLSIFKNTVMADVIRLTGNPNFDHASWGVDENQQPMIRYSTAGRGAYATVKDDQIIYDCYNFGGAYANGTVEKTKTQTAYYNLKTGAHGLLN